jgi:hypothetical protein
MSTIVDIVNPMLRMIVAAEGLGVLERLPPPVDEAPCQMILNLLEHNMRRHYLHDVVLHHPCPPHGGSVSGGGSSAKRGGGKQRDGGSAVAAARRLRRWRQRDSATLAAAWQST